MKIKRISRERFKGTVYNMHTSGQNNYVANGIVTHNCYKGNQPEGKYMSLDTFKKVFDLLNQSKTMTQIALGVDAECKTNPDVWKIMDYCLENGVVPNVTVADIDQPTAEQIVKRCGACAVSCYSRDRNRCFDSIKLLTDEARKQNKRHFQVNMHLLVCQEQIEFCDEVIDDIQEDTRLKGMNAVVLLSLKQKGRGKGYHPMDFDVRKELIERLLNMGVPFGMDSCGAPAFLKIIRGRHDEKRLTSMVEPCESLLYSIYVNVDGKVFPCSFMEGEGDWQEGIDLVDGGFTDFTREVWNHPRVLGWRERAVKRIQCNGCNECPYYNV